MTSYSHYMTTNPSRLFRRGDRVRRIPTNGFRSSGDESTFDGWQADRSRRAGRTLLIGLVTSRDVITTSQAAGLTSAKEGIRSTVHGGEVRESREPRKHFSSIEAIRDDDAKLLGCCCWGVLDTNLFSGRLYERHTSPRRAVTTRITPHFTYHQ